MKTSKSDKVPKVQSDSQTLRMLSPLCLFSPESCISMHCRICTVRGRPQTQQCNSALEGSGCTLDFICWADPGSQEGAPCPPPPSEFSWWLAGDPLPARLKPEQYVTELEVLHKPFTYCSQLHWPVVSFECPNSFWFAHLLRSREQTISFSPTFKKRPKSLWTETAPLVPFTYNFLPHDINGYSVGDHNRISIFDIAIAN
jgi:hypothetical protein